MTKLSLFRRKVWCLAGFVPDNILISRDCSSTDSDRRGNLEALLPDSLWISVFIEPAFDRGMVSSVYVSVHRPVSAPKSQLHRWPLSHRSSHSNHLHLHGLATLRWPRKATFRLLSAPVIPFLGGSSLLGLECSRHNSICIQRTQPCVGDSGRPTPSMA